MATTDLVITLVIEDSTTIQKQGTISVTRNGLGHIRAFKTTNASDMAYAIDQALRELAEIERKVPAKSKPARSKTKAASSGLNNAPEEEAEEAVPDDRTDEAIDHPDAQPGAPEAASQPEMDELHYDLITVTGDDQTPAAYKHAALLAEALRAQKLWNNTTQITFDNPIDAWTQVQAGTLDLQDVLSLYASSPASPARTTARNAPPPAEHQHPTAQVNLI